MKARAAMADLDTVLRCPDCAGRPVLYRIERVPVSPIASGYAVVKAHADLPDLMAGQNACCPDCGTELRRETP